jgi:hypothetical protein
MRFVTLSWRALTRTKSSTSSLSSSYRYSSRIIITPVSAVTTTNRSISTSSYNNKSTAIYNYNDNNNSYDSGLLVPPRRQVAIVGAKSMVREGVKQEEEEEEEEERVNVSTTAMIGEVLKSALDQAGLTVLDLDGIVAVPSLSGNHFMEAHYQATALGLFEQKQDKPLQCHTLDTGGAGPVSALLQGEHMISSGSGNSSGMDVVAVIAADAVGSMTGKQFLKKADDIFFKLRDELQLPKDHVISPAIPHGYDRITKHQLLSSSSSSLTRDQLRMTVCLESFHAGLHPESLQSQKATSKANSKQSSSSSASYTTLLEVRTSPSVTNDISQMECARRADGAACLILASNQFLQERNLWKAGIPVVIGGGQSSGPLYPPQNITDHTYMSCKQAMNQAYASAGNLSVKDIQYFGLYDCFPICLIRAIEACGLADDGGGEYVQKQYERLLVATENGTVEALLTDPTFFPINTHGGLLCYGAPWEVPAMFNIVETVDQLQGQSQGRAIGNCRRALVYGNGGVLSASAVAILETSCL